MKYKVYHGTPNKFSSFDKKYIGNNTNSKGFFNFTDNIDVAKSYGNKIISCEIVLNSPITYDCNNSSTIYFNEQKFTPSEFANYISNINEDLKNQYSIDEDILEQLDLLGFSPMYDDFIDGIILENCTDSFNAFSDISATNYIVFDSNSISIIQNENYKGKYYTNIEEKKLQENTTFFKDDEDKNKDGSRVKNPNRVYAAKKAHRTHGASYKSSYNKRGTEMKQDRASLVAEQLKQIIEAKVEQNNPVNLFSEINSDSTTMGVQVKFDEENYSIVDVTFVAQDKEGVGAYQLETGNADKMEASSIFQSLVRDLTNLVNTFDNDFNAVLKKNGIVRRVD